MIIRTLCLWNFMDKDPLVRMRELREKNKEIYRKMGMVGSGYSFTDE